MLSLAGDKVINVRLTLARALKNHFRTINCTFMHDPLVNQAVKVLLNDKSQDVVDLVQDIVQFASIEIDENSSQSSRNSSASANDALNSFMERLTQSRRSSSAAESDISDMENEIMMKSGIAITKESESPSKPQAASQLAPLAR